MLIKKVINYIKKPFRFIFYRSKAGFIDFTVNKYPNIYRPSSYPYISGDTLRKFSNHRYDETSRKIDLKIKEGEIVFVNLDYLREFLKNVNTKNQETKYTIIAHNNDNEVNSSLLDNIDYSNVEIWTQNLNMPEDHNLHILPIGFENRRFLKNGKIKNLNRSKIKKTKKNFLVTSNFNSNTNNEIRYPIEEFFNSVHYVDTQKFSPDEYLQNLSNYKFAICPPGNGLDTHRIWESLFVNTVPITIKNSFSTNLAKNKIPCLILNKWEDFLELDENALLAIYEEYLINFDFDIYHSFDYWWHRIKNKSF